MPEKTISLSDGDVEMIQNGEKVGPWLIGEANVYVEIDDGEESQL